MRAWGTWLAGLCLPWLAEAAPRLTLAVQDAEVRAVLQQIADSAGWNLMVSETVQGKVSVQVRGEPHEAVLSALMRLRGLGMEQQGRTRWIAPLDELAGRAKQDLAWAQARESRDPQETRLMPLRHARAAEVEKLLAVAGPGGERLLGQRGRTQVDARSNTLLVTDTPARLDALAPVLAGLDRPARQVLIETRLAVVSRNHAESLGTRWKLAVPGSTGQTPLAVAGSDASSLRFGLLGIDARTLDIELSALEAEGRGEVMARPSILAGEQQKARIASGQQIPYQETTFSGATATRFVNAELSLEVTPVISPDGWIQLDLALSHDAPGEIQPSGARAIDTNRVVSQVRIRDGQTLMLGGIFRSQDTRTVSRVPGLGNIPLLGTLFRRQVARQDKQELLVFVTPRLIDETLPPARDETGHPDAASPDPQPLPDRSDGRREDDHRPSAG